MDQHSKDFLYKYLNNASPTGFEAEGQKIWLDYIKPYVDETYVDNYGTAVGIVNPDAPYKVVIEAHADEISWYVNYITPEGYIYVIRNGGSDHQIATSKKVLLHGENGIVEGVFGWPAIHTRKPGKEANPSLDNIFIDVGADSKEEVEEMGIFVGTVITYPDELGELNKGRYFTGRALDNRIGGFMIAEVARRISEEKFKVPFGLYVVNAVQEEVGLRGAEMITQHIKPNVAIVTDVCHDSSAPMYDKKTEGDTKGGKGPVLTLAPAVQNNLLKMLINTAKEKEIPFQRAASSRVTGTDTDAFAYSNGGVPSALISLPLKYMHTTVETAHKDDIENTIKLMHEFVKQLENNHDFRYIK
ncbi:M20/M25/M40 family metallo-hydrolase [Flammeovirga yaeyamensis]|uniref:M20/M25/M40 family metallo-hydrolase n=1 Tax=Flammeovirga yaeyamensis TaxID=367791 RepID=A0AAX1N0N7_9BACT|nr:M42 family metallopeptidase [Flammeovirga yaeyamensis]MBB3698573.1 putative aminopeptidase FrvX [Flammeovirga yaeyamensis]NMF34078.1 M42 family metallopeptidase [Flammeovirga yaeyamensis]QWG01066.1 M20/M25/M40 family metallo-hydrolase [Flammeovirga yaeyamensis]